MCRFVEFSFSHTGTETPRIWDHEFRAKPNSLLMMLALNIPAATRSNLYAKTAFSMRSIVSVRSSRFFRQYRHACDVMPRNRQKLSIVMARSFRSSTITAPVGVLNALLSQRGFSSMCFAYSTKRSQSWLGSLILRGLQGGFIKVFLIYFIILQ